MIVTQLICRARVCAWLLLGLTTGPLHAQVASVIEIMPAVTTGDVDEFAISPDGQSIAFVGTLEGDTADQAYLVPIAGGPATLLNPAGVGDVDGGLAWMPDGSGVVVRYGGGDGNIDNQMYLLPADGSQAATQLTFNNFNVFDPQISADGSTLYYTDARDDGNTDLDDLTYATSIPNAGMMPAPTLITPDDVAEIDTGGYAQLGADIVFAGSLPGAGETRFFRTPVDGTGMPAEILISNAPADYDIDEMMITPDGQSIIFVGNLLGQDELFSMTIGGGDAIPLLVGTQSFADVGAFVISPDGSMIAFEAEFNVDNQAEAYLVPTVGGIPTRISEDLSGLSFNADVVAGVDRIAFTPDGQQLVYLADGRANGVNEMFIVTIPEPTGIALVLSALGLFLLRRAAEVS
ncbi:MAG: hypothetical protein AAGF97_18610 [Planctomycetota bacterium]